MHFKGNLIMFYCDFMMRNCIETTSKPNTPNITEFGVLITTNRCLHTCVLIQ